jgi:hypothetical protein
VRLGYSIRLSNKGQLAFNVDVFNLFNFQAATLVDQNYTDQHVLPLVGGTPADLPTATREGKVKTLSGTLLSSSEVNANHGNPLQYQAPRQLRFGAKVTF